jgi:hypothetical protein
VDLLLQIIDVHNPYSKQQSWTISSQELVTYANSIQSSKPVCQHTGHSPADDAQSADYDFKVRIFAPSAGNC